MVKVEGSCKELWRMNVRGGGVGWVWWFVREHTELGAGVCVVMVMSFSLILRLLDLEGNFPLCFISFG